MGTTAELLEGARVSQNGTSGVTHLFVHFDALLLLSSAVWSQDGGEGVARKTRVANLLRFYTLVMGFYLDGNGVEWCGRNLDIDNTSIHVDISACADVSRRLPRAAIGSTPCPPCLSQDQSLRGISNLGVVSMVAMAMLSRVVPRKEIQ